MEIVEQTLNEQHDVYAEAREEYRKVIQEQRDEIERLRQALKEIHKTTWELDIKKIALAALKDKE